MAFDTKGRLDASEREKAVRLAPRLSVHQWKFTTSRYEGFVEHLDSFEEVVHHEEVNGIDTQRLADAIEDAESVMTSHRQLFDSAREDLEQAAEGEVTNRREEVHLVA